MADRGLEVGDLVLVSNLLSECIHRIVKVSQAGRATTNAGLVITQDLKIYGNRDSHSTIRVATPEDIDRVRVTQKRAKVAYGIDRLLSAATESHLDQFLNLLGEIKAGVGQV